MDDVFADLFEGNERYASVAREVLDTGVARRGLAVVTCIDSRIDPLAVFGLGPGDAKIVRNAGARVTDDVLRSLALAVATLGVTRVALVQHTKCALASSTPAQLVAAVQATTGLEDLDFDPRAITDHAAVLEADVQVLLDSRLLPDGIVVGGFLLDLRSGRLATIVEPRTS